MGARYPESVNQDWYGIVEAVNDHGLSRFGEDLVLFVLERLMSGASSVLHDLRSSIRLLRNNPTFSAVAIATIALVIGANVAMFSFVDGLLFRPLPYPESDRIVRVLERVPGSDP